MQSYCADDVGRHMSSSSEILPKVSLLSHQHVVCMSSACHPHVVCMRFQPQKYFQLNSRATALLKRLNRGKPLKTDELYLKVTAKIKQSDKITEMCQCL